MRRNAGLVFIASILTLMPAAAQEELPSAETILDAYVEAVGGVDAHDAIRNRVTHGTFELVNQGVGGKLTIWHAKPNRVVTRLEIDALGVIERATDGEVAWESSTAAGTAIKEGTEKSAFLRDAIFDRFVYWRDVYDHVQTKGTDDVDDAPCDVVVLTPADGQSQTLCFDRVSHLPVRVQTVAETAAGNVPVIAFMEDYREVDGILLPHRVRVTALGSERMVTTERVEHNVELPADRFDLPEDVRALLAKREEG